VLYLDLSNQIVRIHDQNATIRILFLMALETNK